MVQALTDQSFTKVCVDSGAGESVCPIDAFPGYGTHKTANTGARYTAAGGQELINAGEKRPQLKSGGVARQLGDVVPFLNKSSITR